MKTTVFNIEINGLEDIERARALLDALEEQQLDLSASIDSQKAATEESAESYKALSDSLASISDEITDISADLQALEPPNIRTIASLNAEIEQLEDELQGLEIGSDSFNEIAVKAKRLEKELEFLQLDAESVATGFVGIGKAGNSIEGLEVQMGALKAKFATLDDELEKAEIDKQLEAIKLAIIDAEAEAKKGLFPDGSIGRLEVELEQLSLAIKNVPAGSAEFVKLKAQLDDTNAKVEFLNSSVLDQQQIFKDLGTSMASTFASGAGLLASFAGDSEDAQQSLLILQQAMAAVETLQALSETVRQARSAARVAGLARETVALEVNTVATEANAVAQTATASAMNTSTQATGKSAKAFDLLNAVIKANPIGVVVTTLGVLGATLFALSSKFKPLGDAVNFIKDAFGGVVQVGKDFINNGESIISTIGNISKQAFDLLNPLNNLQRVMNLFGGKFDVKGFKDSINDIKNTSSTAGDALESSFKKGMDRSRKLRALDARETLNSATDLNAQLEEAALGSSRSTADARRAIRLRELAEDKGNAIERLKLEHDLTDAELAILRSGNVEKIKELKKVTNARGEVNEEILEMVGKITETDKSITEERQAAFQEYIQDRIGSVDRALSLETAKLGEVANFDKERISVRIKLNADLEKLELKRQAGEFKTAAEFESEKATLIQTAENERNAIAKKEVEFRRGLAEADRAFEIENLQQRLEFRKNLGESTLGEELEVINRTRELRLESLKAEEDTIDQTTNDGIARYAEIQRERVALNTEANLQIIEANKQAIETSLADALQAYEAQAAELNLLASENANTQNFLTHSLEQQQAILDDQVAQTHTVLRANKLRSEQAELDKKAFEAQNKALEKAYRLELQRLDIEREKLATQQKANEALLNAGAIGEQDAKNRQEAIEAQLKAIDSAQVTATVNLEIDIDKASKELEDKSKQLAEDAAKDLSDYLANPLDAEMKQFLEDTFGPMGEVVASVGQQLFNAIQGFGQALFENQIAGIDSQIQELEDRKTKIEESVSEVNEGISEIEGRVTDLQSMLADARGADRQAVLSQINAEIAQKEKLEDTNKALNNQAKQFAKEEEALELKKKELKHNAAVAEKALKIAEATANTALGVTAALASSPPPLNFILASAVGVAGALQIATIALQPIPLREGGILPGPSHEQGGIKGTGAFAGFEVEGGEAIIPKSQVSQYPTLVDFLLGPNAYKPKSKFASGGIIPSVNTRVVDRLETSTTVRQANELLKSVSGIDIKPVVSVVDITERQNKVATIENRGI